MSLTRTLTLLVTSTVLLIALVAAAWSYIESNHELEELFDAEWHKARGSSRDWYNIWPTPSLWSNCQKP